MERMMRFLRTTMFPSMTGVPATAVVSEADAQDTLESMERTIYDKPAGIPASGRPLTITEIVTLDTDDTVRATFEIMESVDARREADMAILYFYLVDTILKITSAEGMWIAPDPAPLSEAEVKHVFEQVILHPSYRNQTCTTRVEGGSTVEIIRGKVVTTR